MKTPLKAKTRYVGLRLPEEQYAVLKLMADKERRTFSDVVRLILSGYFPKKELTSYIKMMEKARKKEGESYAG